MVPTNPLGMDPVLYAVMCIGLTVLVIVGICYAIAGLCNFKDYSHDVIFDSDRSLLLKLLLFPIWLILATIGVAISIATFFMLVSFAKDLRNWWHKE